MKRIKVSEYIEMIATTEKSKRTPEEDLIWTAYWMGAEASARVNINAHKRIIAEMRARADKCRHPKMANDIIGDDAENIPDVNYAMAVTACAKCEYIEIDE